MSLRLAGYLCNPLGATLTLSADGVLFGTTHLNQGHFQLSFALPNALVGQERFLLKLELDRTHRPADDDRDLGLSFGTIEVV